MDNPISLESGGLPRRKAWWDGLWRYAVAVGTVGLAAAARWGLSGTLGNGFLFITFYAALAVTGMIAGARAGLLATVLSGVAADWLFLEPQFSLKVETPGEAVALALFVGAGVLISWVASLPGKARRREGAGAEALRWSEEQFRTAFENSGIAMSLTAMDDRVLRANRELCRMLGFAEAELLGRKFVDLTYPDDLAENLRGMERV